MLKCKIGGGRDYGLGFAGTRNFAWIVSAQGSSWSSAYSGESEQGFRSNLNGLRRSKAAGD